jgi:dihydropteroate synthase
MDTTMTTPVQTFSYRFGRKVFELSRRTHLMGIVNVTPDSFSDGGKFLNVNAAVAHALQLINDGADIVDIGGESTRPKGAAYGEGADVVSPEEELRRVIPVIERLSRLTDTPLSIDTYKSQVALEALSAGASIVNDISGFTFDAEMPSVVANAGASVVLMHIAGTPKTMQLNPRYGDLLTEVGSFLSESVRKGRNAGIAQVLIDPGIGFGKTVEHNLQLVASLRSFTSLGCPIVIGPSRKSFIGSLLNVPVHDRLEGSLAAAVACVLNGAHVLRVHDVKETRKAVVIADALRSAQPEHIHH